MPLNCTLKWLKGNSRNSMGFLGGSDGKESACGVGDQVQSLGWEDPLEKEMATHSSILAWKFPRAEEPDLAGYSPCGCKELDMPE